MTRPDGRLLPPAGYYRTVEEWFSACQSNGNPTEGNKLDFFSEHDSQFSTPKGLDEAFTPREYHQRLHHSAFVAVIPGGRLWGPRGAVITPDLIIIISSGIKCSRRKACLNITRLEK
ncbi:hypothetical protein EXW96_23630 [Paenibacillus sp. JMULE4]|uniref:hypothetical protein n=1 Tax=Paenibacillus TaxID=44249 RepID=UPI00157637A1|nr:hypothetical protein [Paenibacillus sp. JMULE4]NTZ20410.1 hypothetical protein [Paenibacillus sp. JMULE4]